MSMIIDGRGRGNIAHVDNSNRLLVLSTSLFAEEHHARMGHSFIAHGECHTAAAATGGLLAITNNSSVFDVIITRIYIDPFTITPTDLIVTQVKNPTISSGTDITTTGIINKNYSSNIPFDGTLTVSDASADLTLSGGTQYHAFPIGTMVSPTARDMKGTNIVTQDQTIAWGFKTVGGGDATDGEIISISVNFYIQKKE